MKYLFGKMNKVSVLTFIIAVFISHMTVFAEAYKVEFALSESNCGKSIVSATTGEGSLSASADGTNPETIKWDTDVSMLAPRMQGKKLSTGWNVGGYWLVHFSSKNTSSLKFSADMFSSGKGPKNFQLYYSTDGNKFTPVDNANVSLTKNNTTVYNEVLLPSAVNNQTNVYIKIVITEDEAVNGNSIIGVKDGSTYINNIVITGGESDDGSGGNKDDDKDDDKEPNESIKHYYRPKENYDKKNYGLDTGKYKFSVHYPIIQKAE